MFLLKESGGGHPILSAGTVFLLRREGDRNESDGQAGNSVAVKRSYVGGLPKLGLTSVVNMFAAALEP